MGILNTILCCLILVGFSLLGFQYHWIYGTIPLVILIGWISLVMIAIYSLVQDENKFKQMLKDRKVNPVLPKEDDKNE